MVVESGTRVRLAFTRERTRGTTPAGIGTPVDNVEAVAAGAGGAGFSIFRRASGSWITDGFAVGQRVQAEGFADTDINANWTVDAVSALDLEVVDTGDVIDNEAAAAGQKVRILLQTFRVTSKAINLEKEELESDEVDPDTRQVSDSRHGFNRVVGSPGFQFSRQDFDDIIEIAQGAAFSEPTAVSGINLGIDGTTKILDRASGSWITDGYRVGDIIEVAGFANGANNTNWLVLAVAALNLTLYDPNDAIITEVAGAGRTVSLKGKRCDISTVLTTMYMERQFLDTGKYQKFNGVAINELPFSVSPRAIVTAAATLLGMSSAAIVSASESGVNPEAKSASSPYDAFTGLLHEGGTAITVVTGLDWNINNNRTLEAVIGSKFSPDVFEGDARGNGTLTSFFESETMYNKFVNETESTIFLRLNDPDGTNFCSVVFPRVKYNGGNMDPPQRGPVPIQMPFKALMHSTYLTSIWYQFSHL